MNELKDQSRRARLRAELKLPKLSTQAKARTAILVALGAILLLAGEVAGRHGSSPEFIEATGLGFGAAMLLAALTSMLYAAADDPPLVRGVIGVASFTLFCVLPAALLFLFGGRTGEVALACVILLVSGVASLLLDFTTYKRLAR